MQKLDNDQYAQYFQDFVQELEKRMNECRTHIEELEASIKSGSVNPIGIIN